MHLWHLGKHIKHLAMQLQHWQLIIANASLVDGVRVLFLHFKYVPWTSHMQGVDRAAASCDNLRRRAFRLPRRKTVGTKTWKAFHQNTSNLAPHLLNNTADKYEAGWINGEARTPTDTHSDTPGYIQYINSPQLQFWVRTFYIFVCCCCQSRFVLLNVWQTRTKQFVFGLF